MGKKWAKIWNAPNWRPRGVPRVGTGCGSLCFGFGFVTNSPSSASGWSHGLGYPNISALKEAWSPPNPNIELGPGYSFSTFFFISHLCCSSLGCVTAFFVPTSCRSVGCLRLFVLRFLGCFTWDINSIYHQQANFWPWVFGCLLDTSSQ